MQVSVAYALPAQQWWLDLDVPEGATVISSIYASGLLDLIPQLNLEHHRVGIFGRFVTLETPLTEGDRVEIYRPITWRPPEDDDEDDE